MTDEEDVCPECYRGWGDEDTEVHVEITDEMVEAGAEALYERRGGPFEWESVAEDFVLDASICLNAALKRSGPHQENLGGPNGYEQDTTPFSQLRAEALADPERAARIEQGEERLRKAALAVADQETRVVAAADQMARAIKTKLNEDYRGNAPSEPGLRAALSNYLKVKEGK